MNPPQLIHLLLIHLFSNRVSDRVNRVAIRGALINGANVVQNSLMDRSKGSPSHQKALTGMV